MGKSLVSCFFLTHGVVVCPGCFFLFSSRSFGCFFLFLNEILVHSKPLVLLCFIVVFLRLYYMVTLLVGRQEDHPACKKLEWWGAGVVICLE